MRKKSGSLINHPIYISKDTLVLIRKIKEKIGFFTDDSILNMALLDFHLKQMKGGLKKK
jgi:hypothetical protein